MPAVGFLVWNSFQIGHFAELMRQFDEPDVIILNRDPEGLRDFDPQLLSPYGAFTRFVREWELHTLDGQYDALITQFTPALAKPFRHTKLIMAQYSMAKPKTAFNARWLASDLGIVYGPYSDGIIGAMCPTVQAGNPRFDSFFEERLDDVSLEAIRAKLDPEKKTLLFLPTWGDLSSREKFSSTLSEITRTYNVIYKPHHMTPLRDASEASRLGEGAIDASALASIASLIDPMPYLLRLADVVVSDVSGAIFDALYCRKPVVLMGSTKDFERHRKADPTAVEIARSEEIGPRILRPEDLGQAVDLMATGSHPYMERNEALVAEAFLQRGGCAPIAAEGIRRFLENGASRPPLHIYVAPGIRAMQFEKVFATARSRKRTRTVDSFLYLLPSPLLSLLGRLCKAVGLKSVGNHVDKHALRLSDSMQRLSMWLHIARLWEASMLGKIFPAVQRKFVRLLQSTDNLVETGLAVEDWASSPPPRQRAALFQYLTEASRLRYSRRKWREARRVLSAFVWADGAKKGNTLRNLGALSDALEAFPDKTAGGAQSIIARISELSELLPFIDHASENDSLELPDQRALSSKGEWRRVEDCRERIFELSVPLAYTRAVNKQNDGTRNAMIEFTKVIVETLRKEGWSVLPRLQAGYGKGVPVSGKYPSAMWHTIHCGSSNQLHLKVGSFNGHIVMDERGYSGWSSIADKPLSALIEDVDPIRAREHFQNLETTIVQANRSKYLQSEEAAPAIQKYIFYPMQVEDDAVAKLAYIGGLDLLRMLAEWGSKSDYTIVVKRHPKCTSRRVERALQRESAAGRIVISNASIHNLIAGAKCVVTVNSGVGTEALLHLKPVIIAGRADYAAATRAVRNEGELTNALRHLPEPFLTDDEIKKFLWSYTKRYQIHYLDGEAISARFVDFISK